MKLFKQQKYANYHWLGFCIAVIPDAVQAEDINYQDTYFLGEAPISITASRLSQPLVESPAAVTIIDQAMIQASGAKEIAEVFRLVPGMMVDYYDGSTPIVSYQGMALESVRGLQILIDGTSVNNPLFGGIRWEDFPLEIEDIEQIEVIRGPNTVSYGPNAFYGAINIKTIHSQEKKGFQANIRGGSEDYIRGLLRYSGGEGNLGYRLSLSHKNSSGLNGVFDTFRTEKISGRVDYQLTPKQAVQYNFGYSEGPRQDRAHPSFFGEFERIQHNKNIYQHLRWENDYQQGKSTVLQFTFNHKNIDDKYHHPTVQRQVDNDLRYDSYDLELQNINKPFQNTRLVWGTGIHYDEVFGPLFLNTKDHKGAILYRAFTNLEWRPFDPLIINLGGLYEFNSVMGQQHALSGRFAVNYLFNVNHSARFTISQDNYNEVIGGNFIDFEDPTIGVRYISDTNLDQERSFNLEIGYHGSFFNKTLTLDAKLFRQRFKDQLGMQIIRDDPIVAQWTNYIQSTKEGYELQLDYRPTFKTLIHAGFTHLNKRSNRRGIIDYEQSIPTKIFNALISQTFKNAWQVSLAYYYRSGLQYLGINTPIGPFKRLDFMLSKTFRFNDKNIVDLQFIHQMALDENEVYDELTTFDSRTFFTVSYSYQ